LILTCFTGTKFATGQERFAPWYVTDRRTAEDFAACMRDLTDVYFPEAGRIRVVMDIARCARALT
jgi:hypothetical protein